MDGFAVPAMARFPPQPTKNPSPMIQKNHPTQSPEIQEMMRDPEQLKAALKDSPIFESLPGFDKCVAVGARCVRLSIRVVVSLCVPASLPGFDVCVWFL